MEKDNEYKPNTRYPLQDHLEIDIESNLVSFPQKNPRSCQHVAVNIDSKALELTCKQCGVKVNPVLWIKDSIHYFASIQRATLEQTKRLKDDEAELQKRSRTRCQHCRKMTAINLKHHKFVVVA
jgi:DNA-directed RNA polymerase subunit RPC12/RpoP